MNGLPMVLAVTAWLPLQGTQAIRGDRADQEGEARQIIESLKEPNDLLAGCVRIRLDLLESSCLPEDWAVPCSHWVMFAEQTERLGMLAFQRDALLRALQVSRGQLVEEQRVALWISLAHCSFRLSLLEDSLSYFRLAEEVFESTRNQGELAALWLDRAQVLMRLNRNSEAEFEIERSLRHYRQVEPQENLVHALWLSGAIHFGRSRLSEALHALEEARSIARRIGDSLGDARSLLARAVILMAMKRHTIALQDIDLAQDKLERARDELGIAACRNNRGLCQMYLGNWQSAEVEFEAAIDVYRRLNASVDLAVSLSNLARLRLNQGLVEKGLEIAEDASRLLEASGDAVGLARLYQDLGLLAHADGRFEEAVHSYKLALGLHEGRADEINRSLLFFNLARSHLALGQREQARADQEEAHEVLFAIFCSPLRHLGSLITGGIRDRFRKTPSLCFNLLKSKEDPEARNPSSDAELYRLLQSFYGLDLVDALVERQATVWGRLQADELARMEELGEQYRLLVEQRDAFVDDPEQQQALASVREALKRLQQDEQLFLSSIRARDPRALGLTYPAPATPAEVMSVLPPATVLVEYSLDDDASFCAVTSSIGLAVLDLQSGEDLDDLCSRAHAQLRAGVFPRELLRRLGAVLVDPVIASLQRSGVSGTRQLLIAPHGMLGMIPFELLICSRPAESSESLVVEEYDVSYVHSGTLFRDMNRLVESSPHRPHSRDFVALAYPLPPADDRARSLEGLVSDRGSSSWSPLPGTAQEALEVARCFATSKEEQTLLLPRLRQLEDPPEDGLIPRDELIGERFAVYLRAQATEQRLLRDEVRGARVLHLACHAEADLTSPALSRLVLTSVPGSGPGADGYVCSRSDPDGPRL